MTEEEEKTDEQAEDAPVEDAPAEEAPAEEAPAEQAEEPAAEEDAPAEEAPADEPAAEEPTDQPDSDPDAPGREAEEAAGGDPEEVLTRKQLRKRNRATHTGEAKPPRSVDERIAERTETRKAAAAARRRSRARLKAKREPKQGTPPAEREPGSKKVRQGTVVSSKADKTITVQIEVVRRHPVYEKVVRRSTTIHAHDEANDANAGDTVRVIESRPMSRTKRWRLVEVLERAK